MRNSEVQDSLLCPFRDDGRADSIPIRQQDDHLRFAVAGGKMFGTLHRQGESSCNAVVRQLVADPSRMYRHAGRSLPLLS